MAKAQVKLYHGEPAMMIDGKAYPPMTLTMRTQNKQYLRDMREAGIRVFYVSTMTDWNNPGGKMEDYPYCEEYPPVSENGIGYVKKALDALLEAVPDAYVMLRLNVAPPVDWVNSHPEEMVTFSDGTHRPVMVTTVARGVELDGMPSLCSKAWIRDATKALDEYFAVMTKLPAFEHVIGFFLCAGGTSEWYYPQPLEMADGAYGDFSEPFRAEFEAFLRKKYGTEENLRAAWKNDSASFAHPIIPDRAERDVFQRADEKIVSRLASGKIRRHEGDRPEALDGDSTTIGQFLNVNRFPYVADFYDAWHEATANTIIAFAADLKRRFPELMVGAFYGSYGCTNYFDGGTCTGTPRIMRSGVVDFLAAPGVYNNREPGGIVGQREMQDSFRLHNMMFISEDDIRTHLIPFWVQREMTGLYTLDDSLTVLKRDFGRDLCEDIHGWWFDMGDGWYNDPDILALFRRQQEVAEYAYSLDRTKKNEIALIFDTESAHVISMQATKLVADFYRTSDLGRIGAPVDYYFHDDLDDPNMPDYKLYVMVNQYVLTDAERETVFRKARRNHAVVLWLYAPGFIAPGSEKPMDESHLEKTVGMKVRRYAGTILPLFEVDPDAHPALRLGQKHFHYGTIDRDIHSSVWVHRSEMPPVYADPGFAIADEDATVLGRYCHDGQVAYAMKEMDGFTSVYCAAQVLRSDLIASLAAWAGCHLFIETDDVLFANESFVTLHAKDDGPRTVYFKKPCDPFEVYEKQYYGRSVTRITVNMKKGETKMWCVNGTC